MKIIKYGHACFVATDDKGVSIVVDPGTLSPDFKVPDQTAAIVITHLHPDHWSEEHIKAILEKSPDVEIFAPEDAVKELKEKDIAATPVKAGDEQTADGISLKFTGGEHAHIMRDKFVSENVGILINDGKIYYPGDSFDLPGAPVDILALPVAAPWMKSMEAMDFVQEIKPKRIFPTHDAILADEGKELTDDMMKMAADNVGADYKRL